MTAAVDRDRTITIVVLLVLALVGAGELWFLRSLPFASQVAPIPDDSFFYLLVARRFAETGFLTFDGTNPVYGYQPAWQLLLGVLAPFWPTREGLFHAVQALCVLLHTGLGVVCFGFGRRLGGALVGIVAAALWTANPGTMVWCWGQKENSLYALLLLLALWHLHSLLGRPLVSRGAALGFGIWLGLIVFTRINAVLVSGVVWLAFLGAAGRAGGLRARLVASAWAAVAAIATAAPWYLFAWWKFGSPMPTSGTFKQALAKGHVEDVWGTPWLSPEHGLRALAEWPRYLEVMLERGYGSWRPLLVATALLVPVALCLPKLRAALPVAAPTRWLAATLLLVAAVASFADQMLLPNFIGYADWYAVGFQVMPPLLGALLLRPWLLAWWRIGVLAAAALVVAAWWPITLAAAVRVAKDSLTSPPQLVQPLELGLWTERNTPPSARFALWDPGILSFFSDRRCTSLDPLIGAIDYLRIENIGDPAGYVRRQGVDYLWGVAERHGGQWGFVPLPPGTFDIVWMPYPDDDAGWRNEQDPTRRPHYVLVRPHNAVGAPFVRAEDLPYGVWYPNDPARRRFLYGDRDRLLAGVDSTADVIRLQVEVAPAAAALELRVDGATVRTFPPGSSGWHRLDARSFRGRRLQVVAADGDPARSLLQAHIVDHRPGPDR
jgi:hypothetical protein